MSGEKQRGNLPKDVLNYVLWLILQRERLALQNNLSSPAMTNYTRPLASGINVDISSTGNLARFNFPLFMNAVIAGLVFLGTAKTICDLVATQVGPCAS